MTDDEVCERIKQTQDKAATRFGILILLILFMATMFAMELRQLEARLGRLENPQPTEVRK